jgi:hypothetical protein
MRKHGGVNPTLRPCDCSLEFSNTLQAICRRGEGLRSFSSRWVRFAHLMFATSRLRPQAALRAGGRHLCRDEGAAKPSLSITNTVRKFRTICATIERARRPAEDFAGCSSRKGARRCSAKVEQSAQHPLPSHSTARNDGFCTSVIIEPHSSAAVFSRFAAVRPLAISGMIPFLM